LKQYDLNEDTADFIGHALALHRDDAYLSQPALPTGRSERLLAVRMGKLVQGAQHLMLQDGLAPHANMGLLALADGSPSFLNFAQCPC
jgi:Rab GDP dissociation inhibitor